MNFTQFFARLQQAGLELNRQQQAAVTELYGPLLIVAGPGSGKTRTLLARTAALLHANIAPEQILVLTFTRAAAAAMKNRLQQLPLLARRQAQAVSMSTFHSLCYRILSAERGQTPRLVSEGQRRRWVETALLQQQEEIKEDLVEELLQQISYHKNSNHQLNALQRQRDLATRVWQEYETAKNAAMLLDYEDLLLHTLHLLQEHPDLLRSLRQRWQFIMVDEFQDTNTVQYELLQLLAAPANNLAVVGDIDQAIYAWRAANPELLLQFSQDFPGGQRIELLQNYRSLPPLISFANRLIAHNRLRHPLAVQPVRQGNVSPRLLRPQDEWAEAKAVLTMLQQWRTGQTPLQELAVLYRVNSQARPLVSLLVEADFPFVLREKGQLGLEHWVLQECHAYLRLLAAPHHLESFLRVGRRQLGLNDEPSRLLERLVQERRLTPAAAYQQLPIRYSDTGKLQQLQQHLARACKLPAGAALTYYLKQMGFANYLEWYATQRGYPSDQYLSVAEDLLTDLQRFPDASAYLQHLDRMLAAVAGQDDTGAQRGVNLMSLHAAKGLEFRAVWILGVTEGLLPHKLSRSSSQLEEERRLFYVGCTRAKDYLYLLAPATHGDSPFLAEAFGEQLEQRPAPPVTRSTQAKKSSGGKAVTSAQLTNNAVGSPPPAVGQTLRHKDLGLGRVTACTQEKTRGQTFHVLTLDFPARSDFKLHWELSLELGFVDLDY